MKLDFQLRRAVTLRPIFPTQNQENQLARLYLDIPNIWVAGIRDRIIPAYARALGELVMDDATDIQFQVDATNDGTLRAIASFRDLFSGWLGDFSMWHFTRFNSNLKYATNVDASTLVFPGEPLTLQAIIERNVALVRNVSDQLRGQIQDIVFRGLTNRTPIREVAKEIFEKTGLARDRSRRIASDQLSKISSTMDESRMRDLGIDQFKWNHSGKVHFRPWHKERDGKIFSWDDPEIKNDKPGFAPFCFPSRQPIAIHSDVVKAYRRRCGGELAALVTVSGEVVECTPNHPVLTHAGWKPAKAVEVGDYVAKASASGVDTADVNIEKVQIEIGDLFKACKSIFGSVTIDGRGSDFHGDAGVDDKIDVVNIEWGLRGNLKAIAFEGALQFFLEKAFDRAAFEASPNLFVASGDSSGAGIMRRLCLIETLLWREFGPFGQSCLAVSPQLNAALGHPGNESWARHTESVRDGVGAFAGKIEPDGLSRIELLSICSLALESLRVKSAPDAESLGKSMPVAFENSRSGGECDFGTDHLFSRVKQVVRKPSHGYVYNLETESNWYAADNLIVHNCGCKAQGYIDGEFD